MAPDNSTIGSMFDAGGSFVLGLSWFLPSIRLILAAAVRFVCFWWEEAQEHLTKNRRGRIL